MNKNRKNEIIEHMSNWTNFHPIVTTLSMEEVDFALELERTTYKRKSFIERLIKRRRQILVEKVREENNNS